MHLENIYRIGAMIFYSILTFFIGPYITQLFLNNNSEQCIAGFLIGFTASILLWIQFGKNL